MSTAGEARTDVWRHARWGTVLAMACAVAVGPGAMVPYAFGTFIKAIAADYDLSRAEVSAGFTVFNFTLAFGMLAMGWLIDWIGPRATAILSVCSFCAALLSMTLVTTAPWFFAVFIAMGLVSGAATGLPYSMAITLKFNRRRGLAFGLGAAGVGIGGLILPFYSAYTLENFGWRYGFAALALLSAAISLPSAYFGLRLSRSELPRKAVRARGEADAAQAAGGDDFKPIWGDREYWIIIGAMSLIALGTGGVLVHGMALLTDRGSSLTAAAAVVSVSAMANLLGRVVGGQLMDMFFAPKVASSIFLAGCGGAALILFGDGILLLFGFAIVGFVAGADADVLTYLVSRYCSPANAGRRFGLSMLIYIGASGLSVLALGAVHDRFGTYSISLGAAMVLAVAAAVLVRRLGPYHDTAEDGEN